MNEALFTLVLVLAWFGAVNIGLSGLIAFLGWSGQRGAIPSHLASTPRALLVLRLLPGMASLWFILLVFLPAQWRFEPEGVEETAGVCLMVLAAAGAAILATTAGRALRDLRATRQMEHSWRAAGCDETRQPPVDRFPGSFHWLTDPAPVLALVGIRRPRLFLSRSLVDALTPDELAVGLSHELAHRESRDNVKRALVSCCPDLLRWTTGGRHIEQRWRAAMEFAADARAAAGDPRRALSLASALLKVARLTPPGVATAGSRFYDGTLLSARVERLLSGPILRDDSRLPRAWSIPIVIVVVVLSGLAAEAVWFTTHLATEGLVRLLP
ncbi:MAG TPA: M48 family metalloprotease [Vicinamibacterales bacterium]